MKPGDKVRMLRDKEEGFVTKIINDKLVEIEIEDGFRIPAMRNELVVVASEENNYFDRNEHLPSEPLPTSRKRSEEEGIFLAFHALNDKALSLFFINNTPLTVPFCIYYKTKEVVQGKMAGHLLPHTATKVDEFQRRDFDLWPEFVVQFFQFSKERLQAPYERRIKFKAKSLFREEKQAPLINKKAFLFSLENSFSEVEREKLNRKFSEGTEPSSSSNSNDKPFFVEAQEVIDLHIEKLVEDVGKVPPEQILKLQLEAFEKALDTAIAGDLKEITFIHGVGNGVLRNAIHKSLSKNQQILFFKDAMKEKFGYGATVAQLIQSP